MSESMLDKNKEVQGDAQIDGAKKASGKHGCFFWGCLTAVVLVVLGGLAAGIATYSMVKYLRGFTSDTAGDIAVYEPDEDEYEAIQQKINVFKEAVEQGKSGVELILTGDDINAIIASDEDLEPVRGKAYVRIVGDKISVDASIPLEGVPFFSGRYMNGSADIKVSMDSGILMVTMDGMTVNGKAIPEKFMKELRKENLAKNLYEDEEKVAVLRKVEDVRVVDGKLVLVSK